jgi:hypothetical protein
LAPEFCSRFAKELAPLPVGEPAPDLMLPALEGDGSFHLSSFRGSRPVLLIFGSFT